MNHYAKKKFGQNFLTDKNILKKIVSEAQIDQKHVIEIGPGLGSLTHFIASQAKQVIAYEIDQSLKPFLDRLEEDHPNLRMVYQDFLIADLNKEETWHVVANVPYYITTPIIFKILETPNIQSATLMIQKEVMERLVAKPNTKAYNALSILIQYQTDIKKVMDVKRHLFQPAPHVDSAVIRMVKKNTPMSDHQSHVFYRWIKEAFRQKRKTLMNNLHQAYQLPKGDIEKKLIESGFNSDVRAEALSLDEFILLFGVFHHD